VLIFVLAGGSAFAQRDANINSSSVLRELETLVAKREGAVENSRAEAVRTLRPAASGGSQATSLYQTAVQETLFAGKQNQASAFADWRKANGDLLRSRDMQTAVGLHVRYLLLGMEAARTEDDNASAAASAAYASDLAAFLANADKLPKEASQLLNQPASDGVFAKWLRLGPFLPPAKQWEPAAGNLEGILEKNVRSVWRKTKNPDLLQTHDLVIEFESRRVADGKLEHAADRFNSERLPRLLYLRAKDTALLGMKNRAASELMDTARRHPDHPDFDSWAQSIRQWVANETPAS
jgi:hypothetical protein